ncbi:hypothetical protein D3C85_366100 [compost metagenome]
MLRLSARSDRPCVACGSSPASGSTGLRCACEGRAKGSCASGSGIGTAASSARRGAFARMASQSAADGICADTCVVVEVAAAVAENGGGGGGAGKGAGAGAFTGAGAKVGIATVFSGGASPRGSAPSPNRSAKTSEAGAAVGSSALIDGADARLDATGGADTNCDSDGSVIGAAGGSVSGSVMGASAIAGGGAWLALAASST